MRPLEPLVLALVAQVGALKVPNVAVTADAADEASRADAPIVEVTVFSDRARVRRRGRVPLEAAGVGVVRLPDLPGATFLDTIRVSAGGGRVLRVEATPVERERLGIAQAVKLLDALDAARDKIAELDDRVTADEWEVAFLDRLAPAPPVPEEKREGRKGLLVDVAAWGKSLDFIGQRAGASRARLAHLAGERQALVDERERLRAEIGKLDRGGFSRRVVTVVAVLEARAGAAPLDVQLEYFVPGASWKPAYDLHFASAHNQVRLETAAVVEQATGEDWEAASLSFSTAVPGRGIDMPELLTWTLGERSEFVPRLRPREPLRAEPLLPFPTAPDSERAQARAVELALLRERLALARVPAADKKNRQSTEDEAEKARIKQLVAEDMAVAGLDGDSAPPPPPPRRYAFEAEELASADKAPPRVQMGHLSARRQVVQKSYEASDDEGEAEEQVSLVSRIARVFKSKSAPARPAPPAPEKRETFQTLALALNDGTQPRRAPHFSDPYLPAVSGGGLDYVYAAPVPTTVPSTGKQMRIPLVARTFRAAVFHEATPALAATAFLRARVRNDGERPLLRGPVVLFGDGELVGQGEIRTTGPSGDLELPLGADQDIRLVRQVVHSTKTTGLLRKSDETTYEVRIQVGNYKKQPATVEVIDQVPRSRNDDIDVQLLGTSPAPRAAMDIDGTLRFRLDIPAGATRTIELRYKIVRPTDWILYQR